MEASADLPTVSAFVDVAMEGMLSKEGRVHRSWKSRYFVLEGTNLFYFSSNKPNARALGVVDVDIRAIRPLRPAYVKSKKFGFETYHETERTYFFSAKSQKEQDDWMGAIKRQKELVARMRLQKIEEAEKLKEETIQKKLEEEKRNQRPEIDLDFISGSTPFPATTINQILRKLSVRDLPLLFLVNRKWKKSAESDSLWFAFVQVEFSDIVVGHDFTNFRWVREYSVGNSSWKGCLRSLRSCGFPMIEMAGSTYSAGIMDESLYLTGKCARGSNNRLVHDSRTFQYVPVCPDGGYGPGGDPIGKCARVRMTSICNGTFCVVTTDGRVALWGPGSTMDGIFESSSSTDRPKMLVARSLAGRHIVMASVAEFHRAVLDSNGVLLTWGKNGKGQLGHGNETDVVEPTPVSAFDISGTRVASVCLGPTHTLAVSQDGRLFSWGASETGCLGLGAEVLSRPLPTQVESFSGHAVACVSARYTHALATTSRGRLFSWGSNSSGQLGIQFPEEECRLCEPMEVSALVGKCVVCVGAGFSHSLAVTDRGVVYVWGMGEHGQLGLGFASRLVVPVKRLKALDGIIVSSVSAGHQHSLCVDESGRLFTWGLGSEGQLGHAQVPVALGVAIAPLPRVVENMELFEGSWAFRSTICHPRELKMQSYKRPSTFEGDRFEHSDFEGSSDIDDAEEVRAIESELRAIEDEMDKLRSQTLQHDIEKAQREKQDGERDELLKAERARLKL